jgi:hypothetical protein
LIMAIWVRANDAIANGNPAYQGNMAKHFNAKPKEKNGAK